MNILSKKALGPVISFKSANDKISVDINDSTNGPLFTLIDGSKIQFTDMLQYYNIITDGNIYDIDSQDFNIDEFKSRYFVDSDDVDLHNISEVELYRIEEKIAYRYIAS